MPRHVLAKHGPHPIDVHVGNRVRLRRTLLDMSQAALGEALGLNLPAGPEIRARRQSHKREQTVEADASP